ncbi:NUDIX hydrolase [Frankia sp. CNm7]|uniref:NUDIX hydrolase n=1 Tax=Frankia nepalensis TaxID=1836974 RepID=A0A937RLR7_9ACTN|nr:NUDIX hydrolase [Frankia nepalensis]MBL7499780.1 NUDIX hydrolase [Frankia nepalensis]MBL7512265.1 NUDIX hydrolase [Frankia nepalensis]MBL7520450.1 NUDIX hydrolase [Frankia nepalensis]MBL7632585.1 NUDIX hydrolase [Frankia nepalensis]
MSVEREWEASYQGRDAAEFAYLAEGNARQARKRVSADAVIRDETGRLLLVDPTYKPDWDLPGGMAEANEPPRQAVRRELKEELDLDLHVGELLCVDWVSPHGPWDDLLAFVFDGGTLSADQARSLHAVDPELAAIRFCPPDEVARLLRPYVWRRVQAALTALDHGGVRYLQDGCV